MTWSLVSNDIIMTKIILSRCTQLKQIDLWLTVHPIRALAKIVPEKVLFTGTKRMF